MQQTRNEGLSTTPGYNDTTERPLAKGLGPAPSPIKPPEAGYASWLQIPGMVWDSIKMAALERQNQDEVLMGAKPVEALLAYDDTSGFNLKYNGGTAAQQEAAIKKVAAAQKVHDDKYPSIGSTITGWYNSLWWGLAALAGGLVLFIYVLKKK